MNKKIIRYLSMVATASLGLWSGSTAARHIEDQAKSSPPKIEHVKIELPVLVTSVPKAGEAPMIVRVKFSPSVPITAQANPALNDMLSDALLKATVETFSNPTKEMLMAPELALNKIVNITNSKLSDVVVDELHASDLSVFKYMK